MVWHVQSPAGLRQPRAGITVEQRMRVHFGVITAHMTAGIGMTGSIQGMQGGVTAASMTGTGSTDMTGAAVIETAACLLRRARTDTEMTGCSVVSAQYWQLRMPACPCTQESAFNSFKLVKYERPTGTPRSVWPAILPSMCMLHWWQSCPLGHQCLHSQGLGLVFCYHE